jgi:two-component system chemotaxis response regulator CheB
MVDESAIFMQLFARELDRHFDLHLVSTARTAAEANQKIEEFAPDVITLDIETSRFDAPAFLAELMRRSPKPVIALSSPTDHGAALAMQALMSGAVDVLHKPDGKRSIDHVIAFLLERIRMARGIKPLEPQHHSTKSPSSIPPGDYAPDALIAIGSSCGGIAPLDEILSRLPSNSPPTVIVQQLPPRLTALLIQRFNDFCHVQVKEAAHGEKLTPGQALISPGGRHMLLRRVGADLFVQIKDGPDVFHQKPSVDVLFNSIARAAGAGAIGALLWNNGSDGSQGLLNLRKAGAHTILADGAHANPGAEQIVPIDKIAGAMLEMASHRKIYRTAQ